MKKPPDPLRGMSREIRAQFDGLPVNAQQAYIAFRLGRVNRRGAHRDQLEAFIAGYAGHARPRKVAA